MTETPEARSEFKLVLNGVPSDSIPAVAYELTTLFPLDLPTAVNIAKNAPMILLDKLSVQQARNVGSYAIRLKALGADVQVTSQPVGKLQVLRWPVMPDIARRPATHIICPNCGSRLHVQVFVPAAQTPTTAAEPEPGPAAAVLPSGNASAASSSPIPARPVSQPAPAAPRTAPTAPAASAPVATPSAPSSPLVAVSSAAAPAEPEEEEVEEVVLEPMAGEEGDLLDLSEEELVKSPDPTGSAPGPPVGGEGSCRVTLVGRVRGKKRMQAAELMAYYMGITKEEAISQLGKTVVTVGKDLTTEQAETCKNQFAQIGVKVKIKG